MLLASIISMITIAPIYAMDTETLERLERVIDQQQKQIESQSRAIEALRQEMEALKKGAQPVTAASDTKPAVRVKPGNKNASLEIYGQVNKGILLTNDGNEENVFLVDNDNSSTRLGLVGSVNPAEGIDVGTKIEVEFQSNASNEVSQDALRNVGDNHFKKRWLDLWFDVQKAGKFSLGWGSTASDGTAETDLSGTSVIGYSSVDATAGGHLFYDRGANALSTTTIGSVFKNMDGLSRDERIRYDSPTFFNTHLSGSYISDGGYDMAVRYSAQFGQFKTAAALARAFHGGQNVNIDSQWSTSFSLLHDSGFNATFAGGIQDFKAPGRNDGTFYYTKFGYIARWCPLGSTALSVDFGRYKEIALNDDEADTYGAQLVQNMATWGTEYFIGYRLYKLDRTGSDFDDVRAMLTGFRVKF